MSDAPTTLSAPPGGRGLAWKQLLRLGNVFTAASNVVAGFLITHGRWEPATALAALVSASMLMYAAGMALNDAFDAPLDARERPERPIPSGRIARRSAFAVGWGLLGFGIALAAQGGAIARQPGPLFAGCCLALTIVMYDAGLKSTWAGPAAMGWCRALNVLLGASASPLVNESWEPWIYAAGVGGYTVILTLLARSEVSDNPTQAMQVRRIVTLMIKGFIVIDAVAATLAAGWPSGLSVLLLLVPTTLMARRAPMT
jgi:4-hydroxybenzoate polyprenyltransferase